jgi:microcystin-dependent protein
MGLESATFINDLVITNPLAGDKKNQGDDHLRLLKQVLKQTFPNGDEAFYIPELRTEVNNYVAVVGDHRALIRVSTAGGIRFVTLPIAGIPLNYSVRIAKYSADTNPLFVQASSGNISVALGNIQKVRLNVPYEMHDFVWDGGGWTRMPAGTSTPAGSIIPFLGFSAPIGYVFIHGGSLAVVDHPELFLAWGYGYGGAGASFDIPNMRDRFPVVAGNLYATGGVGGAASVALTTAQLPAHNHDPININDPTHNHPVNNGTAVLRVIAGPSQVSGAGLLANTSDITTQAAATGITASSTSVGGNQAHENLPPYFGVNFITRLC